MSTPLIISLDSGNLVTLPTAPEVVPSDEVIEYTGEILQTNTDPEATVEYKAPE
jgi:hypothetical protein